MPAGFVVAELTTSSGTSVGFKIGYISSKDRRAKASLLNYLAELESKLGVAKASLTATAKALELLKQAVAAHSPHESRSVEAPCSPK